MNINLASLEYLRNQNIHFCVPLTSGQISVPFFQSFIEWVKTADQLQIKWKIDTETDTDQTNNILIEKFLTNLESTHLMFINPNLAWEPHHILQLLSSEKHIIGGIINNTVDRSPDMRKENEILEVSTVNSKFLMISKEAIGHLSNHHNVNPLDNARPYFKTFFDNAEIDGVFYNEEQLLCKYWKDMGGKAWIHSDVKIMDK